MKNLKKIVFAIGIGIFSVAFLTTACAQDMPKLTDAEIASVAVVANQNDMDFANIAIEKSQNPEVINFAKTMIADHQSVIDMAVALVTKLGVTPMDNAVSKQYRNNAKETMDMLKSKSAMSFDKAYVDNEVAYHEAVISAVNTVLIPQAQNKELKALLEKVVPILETHLDHAKMIQNKMR